MKTLEVIRPASELPERLLEALSDPKRRERSVLLLLGAYWAAWSLYGAVAKGSQDLNFDMGEMFDWSRRFLLGTPKHPPLASWLVGVWFSVFPQQDWAYYVLAMLLPTAALWIAWHISERWLPPQKRVVGLVLLTLVPFYNFHALKFNANTVLTPLWAATTWWFLRSFETRRMGWAALAGIGAAACMLGKYWSFFLLAGLGFAALVDPRRAAYFRSPAPWLTVAVGAAALGPHLAWIVLHDFEPFRYAFAIHATTLAQAIVSGLGYAAGTLGYIAAPLLLAALLTHPSPDAVRDTLWPADVDRRMAVVAFAAPIFLPLLAAVSLDVQIVSLWTMSAMTLLPVVLLSSPLVTLSRDAAVRLLALAIAFPLLMIAAAPLIGLAIQRSGVPDYATHYRLIARAVERAWRERTDAPLAMVGSSGPIPSGIEFYLPGRPSLLQLGSPQEQLLVRDDPRIARDGIALVCPEQDAACLSLMQPYIARYPAAQVEEVTLARRYLGVLGEAVRYKIAIIPPQT